MTTTTFPCFTRATCELLQVDNDKKLNDLIRCSRIDRPPVISGRRLWHPTHVRQAAEALGKLTPELAALLVSAEGALQR